MSADLRPIFRTSAEFLQRIYVQSPIWSGWLRRVATIAGENSESL